MHLDGMVEIATLLSTDKRGTMLTFATPRPVPAPTCNPATVNTCSGCYYTY